MVIISVLNKEFLDHPIKFELEQSFFNNHVLLHALNIVPFAFYH